MDLAADLMGLVCRADTVAGTFRLAVPLVLAALGGLFSERSGVVNIALEGIMLHGAFSAVAVTHVTGSPWLGVVAGVAAGVLTGCVHAYVTITAGADQIISGVGINLTAIGLTQFLCSVVFESASNSPTIPTLRPWFGADGVEASPGMALWSGTSPLAFVAVALVFVSHVVLYRTPFGLRLRAVGEHPTAADTMGIPVGRTRYLGVMISGGLAGLGGVYLAMDAAGFVQNMTAGRGYIALAALIFGKWTPFGACGACLLFGLAMKLQFVLKGAPSQALKMIPSQFWESLPYLATIVVLAGFVGRAAPPAALGRPYEKTEG